MDLTKIIENFLSVGGIAGIIAVLIAGTICARYYKHGSEDIPKILTYALSTIIGFYFGTAAAPKSTNQPSKVGPATPTESVAPR